MKKLLSISFIAAISLSALAQTVEPDYLNMREGEDIEYCLTHKVMAKALKDNPEGAKEYYKQQELTRQAIKGKGGDVNKGTIYVIPIVFHVLHINGVENISEEQILDQVEILNRDYRLQNADASTVQTPFQGMPTDVEIEFRLATIAPDGTCFSGITRTQSSMSYNASSGSQQVQAIKQGNDVYHGEWPGDEYLNVFVLGSVAQAGAAGYTTNPGFPYFDNMKNGIYILHNYIGSIGTSSVNKSRALTHEVGHWLNLNHTWGTSNDPGLAGNCDEDDGVQDTPLCKGVISCVTSSNSCDDTNDPNNWSSWTTDVVDNVENYMDYSYCTKMFTPDQVTRMRTAIINNTYGGGYRANVWSSQNLANTGADGNLYLCKAEFISNKNIVCLGDSVQFTDLSYNSATNWNWTFDGGTPSTSTDENPVVYYNTPGIYQVALSASDGTNSDVETKTSYIRVMPDGWAIPFFEGFENYYLNMDNISEWAIENDGGYAWELETSTGLNSNQCARLLNFGQPNGRNDELISSPKDLSGVSTNVTLSFRYAYNRRSTSDDDYFWVYASKDCGTNWDLKKTMHGFQLSSTISTSQYTPLSAAEWTTVHIINIDSSYLVNNFQCKFKFQSGGGNNMYLDNINLYEGGPSETLIIGLNELEGSYGGLNLYPNPADNEVNFGFNVSTPQNVELKVQDITGKEILNSVVIAATGNNVTVINTEKFASGTYFLNARFGDTVEVMKFVVK